MINTLYLPELREMIAEGNAAELHEFCEALHPARTAEFMEGLTASEAWEVLKHTNSTNRVETFGYFDPDQQVEIIESCDRQEISQLIADLPADDRVDLLNLVDPAIVDELLALMPVEERRDILRLGAYPEQTAGSVMTSEIARLSEQATVAEAFDEIRREAADWETIYYLYVVDDENHLRGVVTARQLLANVGRPERRIADLMESDVFCVNVLDDQETVAEKVAQYDLHAIPVVDREHRLVGIITHDDIIDVVREEATEDAQRQAALQPLARGYLETHWFTLARNRALWLLILLFAALLTVFLLHGYTDVLDRPGAEWLVWFIPLIISAGGNSGSQSATLVITAMTAGDLAVSQWARVLKREVIMGVCLGGFLAFFSYLVALVLGVSPYEAIVIPVSITLVVMCGTLCGGLLPLLFRKPQLGSRVDEQSVRGRHRRHRRDHHLHQRGDGDDRRNFVGRRRARRR